MNDFRVKAICINLVRCEERRERMTQVGLEIEKCGIPFDFNVATDYNDVTIKNSGTTSVNKDVDVNGKYQIQTYYRQDIEVKGVSIGYQHDPKKYLLDQVEHFGRNHFRTYQGIPYAEGIMAVDHDDHDKKWITTMGEKYHFYVNISNFRKCMTMGEIACVISHFNVIQQLLNDDEYDYYLILEDDVKLTSDTEYSLDKILQHISLYKTFWDIVFLNEPRFITPNSLHSMSEFLNIGVYSSFTQACSYIISKKSAKYLVKKLGCAINITMDDFLSRQQELVMLRTKKPVFILDDTSNDSNIREYHVEKMMEEKFKKYNVV